MGFCIGNFSLLIDEMRVARPLTVRAEDAVYTGVGYVEYNFINGCRCRPFQLVCELECQSFSKNMDIGIAE